MTRVVIWAFWVTVIVIPVSAILSVAHATVWRRMGRAHATGLAWAFATMCGLAILVNPLLNHIVLFPLYGNGVNRMLNDLKREHFVGKSTTELIARFGNPSIRMVNPGSDEDLIFACHPWFYWSYPEGVCVTVAQGKVASFAYYH